MISRDVSVLLLTTCLFAATHVGGGTPQPTPAAHGGPRYEDLVSFFREWRAFQKPKIADGVPDYTAAAMAAQQRELATFRQRLAAIDPSGWSIPQQVDYHIVRAEVNGLDFDHRVLKPWANNPGFYVTVFSEESDQPAREGPFALGAVELWSYTFPLSAENAARIQAGIRAVPGLLAQAKTNLTGSGKDLWTYGTKAVRDQSAELAKLAAKLDGAAASLKTDVESARRATDEFAAWLESQAASKTGPSGVGIENYDWYLKNVQLVPYTWQQEVALMERELARSRALLAMEELKNAKLPLETPVASADEFDRRFNAAVTEYMAFLKDHEILTVEDYLDPALRARIGSFSAGPREFFPRWTTGIPRSCAPTGITGSTRRGWRASPIRARSGARSFSTTSSTRAPRATPRAGKS